MRRFEYRGGGSEKFWDIDLDGRSVTVQFGRLGTKGQTRVKHLDSANAAGAHIAKLIAEKLKKGYVECAESPVAGTESGATSSAVPASVSPSPRATPPTDAELPEAVQTLRTDEEVGHMADDDARISGAALLGATSMRTEPDEEAWSVPATWWRSTEPLRGRGPKSTKPDERAAAGVATLRAEHRPVIVNALDSADSDPEITDHARRFLAASEGGTQGDVHPVGAAAVASVLVVASGWRQDCGGMADEWVLSHDVAFAAEAGVLMPSVGLGAPDREWRGLGDLVVRRQEPDTLQARHAWEVLPRLRALIAAASNRDYAAVVERLGAHRDGASVPVRLASSYLAPTEQQWLDADIALARDLVGSSLHDALWPLLASVTTAEQASAVLDILEPWGVVRRPGLVVTMVAHLGPAAAPLLARLFDTPYGDSAARKRIVALLAALPTDEAFDLLLRRLDKKYVQPAVIEAMARFPRRAMRLLSAAATGDRPVTMAACELLRGHALAHRELADAVGAAAGSGAAAVTLSRSELAGVAPAAPEHLPAVLVTPPWTALRTPAVAVAVELNAEVSATTVGWRPGEQSEWADTPIDSHSEGLPQHAWDGLVQRAVDGELNRVLPVVAMADAELVRSHLASLAPQAKVSDGPFLRRVLARFGADAAALALAAARAQPPALGPSIIPLVGSAVADLMATWYARPKMQPVVLAWLERHPPEAARDLVPLAVGRAGKRADRATEMLRVLDELGHGGTVRGAAAVHGRAAADAVEAVLARDALHALPDHIPALPAWLEPAQLPQVLLRDRTAALPPEAVRHLCTMLAMSTPGAVFAGIDVVREAVEPSSLIGMAWGLFECWGRPGYPPKDGWVLTALGLLGDDDTARRLAPLIRAWPGQSAHARAVAGLDVLVAIGTDVALVQLHDIAERVKFKALKAEAAQRIEQVAGARGLTAEQLGDRLVPDFGLDADGSLLVDYGPRCFRVGLDERLRPLVCDDDGTRRSSLPKPGAEDDPVLAPAAFVRFTALKKGLKTVGAGLIHCLESAMVAGRRWTAAEHRELLVRHPVVGHLARRLVWCVFDVEGVPTGTFWVVADGALADVDGRAVTVDDAAFVGVAHPLHLGDDVAKWSERFAKHGLLQPFPQLERGIRRLSDEEWASTRLVHFEGTVVPTLAILGLERRGWERGPAQDAGVQEVVCKAVPGGRTVVIDLAPGIVVGEPDMMPEQTLVAVWLSDVAPAWATPHDGRFPFLQLDAITASELVRDLESLRS